MKKARFSEEQMVSTTPFDAHSCATNLFLDHEARFEIDE